MLRMTSGVGAFASFEAPAKVEVFALSSFACCLFGALVDPFPLAVNLAVALLARRGARSARPGRRDLTAYRELSARDPEPIDAFG